MPINARSSMSEFSYIIRHSGSSLVIFGEEFKDAMHSISAEVPLVNFVSLLEGESRFLAYDKLINSYSNKKPNTEANLDDIAWLFYTSGTGTPGTVTKSIMARYFEMLHQGVGGTPVSEPKALTPKVLKRIHGHRKT